MTKNVLMGWVNRLARGALFGPSLIAPAFSERTEQATRFHRVILMFGEIDGEQGRWLYRDVRRW